MYRSIIYLGTIAVLSSCGQDKKGGNFELKGNFTNTKGETIYLEKLGSNEPVVVDSAVIDDKGDFEFLNYTPKIGFYRVKSSPQNFAMLVLDSADKIKLSGNV